MKAPSRNSIFLNLNSNRARTLLAVLVLAVILGGAGWAQAVPVSVKLTTDALGLGSSDINRGGTVDPDMSGFFTSTTTGEGSILTIQTDGLAGPGTAANPLFVTLTAKTHLDVMTNLPSSPHDYQAGVIFISEEKSDLPDGKKEGLGVRAFKVDSLTGRRELDPHTLLPLLTIEGSKDVSGGTDNEPYDPFSPNGAPHVDEAVKFDFNKALFNVNAQSVVVLLSKFDPTDIVDLHIVLTSGSTLDFNFMQTTSTNIFERVDPTYDKLWKLKFSGLSGLGSGDFVDYFTVRANDDDPQHPSGTAEHFLITGFTAVPEPATVVLLGLSSLSLILRRRR